MRPLTRKKMAALSSVTFTMVFGNSMLIPVLNRIQEALKISFFQVGLFITCYSVAASVFIPIFGYISDHVKRKYVILAALALYGLGGGLMGLLALSGNRDSYTLMLGARVLQGIGAAGMSPIVMALVGDMFTTEEKAKALGLIEGCNIFGKVISPILGSLVAAWAWYVPFFVYPAFALPVLVAVLLLIAEPENKGKIPLKKYLGDLKKIFGSKGKYLWISYFCAWTAFLIMFGVLSFLSDTLENSLRVKGMLKGVAIAVPVAAWTASSLFSGFYLQKKTGRLRLIVLGGLALLVVSLAFFPLVTGLWPMLAGVVIMGLGGGLVIPSLTILVSNCAPFEERGGIVSLYGSIRFFGVAVGPPVFSSLAGLSRRFPFWLSAAAAALCALLILRISNREIIDLCQKK